MVNYSPSLFWQSIDLNPTLDEVDGLSGSDETLELRILEKFPFNATQSTIVMFCANDVSPE